MCLQWAEDCVLVTSASQNKWHHENMTPVAVQPNMAAVVSPRRRITATSSFSQETSRIFQKLVKKRETLESLLLYPEATLQAAESCLWWSKLYLTPNRFWALCTRGPDFNSRRTGWATCFPHRGMCEQYAKKRNSKEQNPFWEADSTINYSAKSASLILQSRRSITMYITAAIETYPEPY
jgi:hypothetical protein